MRRWFLRWILPFQLISLLFGLLVGSLTGCPLSCCDHEETSGTFPRLSATDHQEDESHHFCPFLFCSTGSGFLLSAASPVLTLHDIADPVFVRVSILQSLSQSEFFRPPILVS